MNSTEDHELRAEIERLMDAYWAVSGHNRDEKRPLYSEAILALFSAHLDRKEREARLDELQVMDFCCRHGYDKTCPRVQRRIDELNNKPNGEVL